MIFSSLFGDRLKKSRKGLGWSQAQAAEISGVSREHWGRCERGESVLGGEVLATLAAHGVDVLFVLTGQPASGVSQASTLTADEAEMLSLFRAAPLAVKAAAIGALQGGSIGTKAQVMKNTGSGNVQIGNIEGGYNTPTPAKKRAK